MKVSPAERISRAAGGWRGTRCVKKIEQLLSSSKIWTYAAIYSGVTKREAHSICLSRTYSARSGCDKPSSWRITLKRGALLSSRCQIKSCNPRSSQCSSKSASNSGCQLSIAIRRPRREFSPLKIQHPNCALRLA